jgi:phosphoglycolate phosphatase
MPVRFSNILIDLDGTLVDSIDGLHAACLAAAKTIERPPPDLEFVRRSIGRGSDRLLHLVLRGDAESMLEPDLHQRARAAFDRHYASACLGGSHLRVGVAESLRKLRAEGRRLVVATNKPRQPAELVLRHLGLDELTDGLCCPEDAGCLKPDPEFVSAAVGNPDRSGVILVGDSGVDAATADAASIPFIAVRGGYDEGRDIATRTPSPSVVIETPEGLPTAIRALEN